MADQTLAQAAALGIGALLSGTAKDVLMKVFGKELEVYGDWRAFKAQKRVERWKLAFEQSAAMIEASGKPAQEVSDKLLFAIFDGMSLEDDEDLRRCWAALLANAASEPGIVRTAFASILIELSVSDAKALEAMYEDSMDTELHRYGQVGSGPYGKPSPLMFGHDVSVLPKASDEVGAIYDNLCRVRLLEAAPYDATPSGYKDSMAAQLRRSFHRTSLGWAFVKAVRPPKPATATPGTE